MTTYYTNRNSVNILIFLSVLTVIIGIPIILFATGGKVHSGGAVGIITLIVQLPASIIRLKSTLKYYISIDQKITYYNGIIHYLEFKDIKKITYKGIKFLPIFDFITIEFNNSQKIHVDYLFNNYTEIWSKVISICEKENCNVQINKRLLKRIK